MLSVNRIAAKKYLDCVSHFSPPEINPAGERVLVSSVLSPTRWEQEGRAAELLPGHCSWKDLAGSCPEKGKGGEKGDLSLPR